MLNLIRYGYHAAEDSQIPVQISAYDQAIAVTHGSLTHRNKLTSIYFFDMDKNMDKFDYHTAFSRNIGWVTEKEQLILKNKKVAIGGLGGVGGSHLIVLSRMGVGKFHISDLDVFEIANFNRQYGACISTLNKPKAEIMERTIKEINPEAEVTNFHHGITMDNLEEFLKDVDIYVDSLDIFALEIRRAVFARCYELGIPTITAAPMGMGTAMYLQPSCKESIWLTDLLLTS